MASSSGTNKIVLIIIALIIPPVAVLIERGVNKEFWISLVLTILFFFPGLVYSLYVLFK